MIIIVLSNLGSLPIIITGCRFYDVCVVLRVAEHCRTTDHLLINVLFCIHCYRLINVWIQDAKNIYLDYYIKCLLKLMKELNEMQSEGFVIDPMEAPTLRSGETGAIKKVLTLWAERVNDGVIRCTDLDLRERIRKYDFGGANCEELTEDALRGYLLDKVAAARSYIHLDVTLRGLRFDSYPTGKSRSSFSVREQDFRAT